MIRALDCCAKHRWFERNPRNIVGMLAHCLPSSKWVPGGNRNWPPYITMPAAQDKCPSDGHSPNVRNRAWDSPLPLPLFNTETLKNLLPHVFQGVLSQLLYCIYTRPVRGFSCVLPSPIYTLALHTYHTVLCVSDKSLRGGQSYVQKYIFC